jgi:hypothetical protein
LAIYCVNDYDAINEVGGAMIFHSYKYPPLCNILIIPN